MAFRPSPPTRHNRGFTLIEVSIVLVIIALIIAGILVGQDMINAAATRQQIAQIDKYNSAVHTFQSKYGGLPGDLADPSATAFGFIPRGTGCGQGDGNGILSSNWRCGGFVEASGETAVFWVD